MADTKVSGGGRAPSGEGGGWEGERRWSGPGWGMGGDGSGRGPRRAGAEARSGAEPRGGGRGSAALGAALGRSSAPRAVPAPSAFLCPAARPGAAHVPPVAIPACPLPHVAAGPRYRAGAAPLLFPPLPHAL